MSSFSGFRIVSRGIFRFTKMCGFLAFVNSHHFSVVVTYVIVHSSRRQGFKFRTYFRSHFWWIWMHACTAQFRLFLWTVCSVVEDVLCTVQFVCRFYRILTMGKRKRKFKDELKSKYPCFRNGLDEWETECLVCKPGTYVSVANKSALHLWAHVGCKKQKKAVTRWNEVRKSNQVSLLNREENQMMLC